MIALAASAFPWPGNPNPRRGHYYLSIRPGSCYGQPMFCVVVPVASVVHERDRGDEGQAKRKSPHQHPDFARRAIAQLSVSDRGSGIPEEKLNTVFEPFFTSKAMGMGLSIARTIVKAHKERYRQKIGITAVRRSGLSSRFLPTTLDWKGTFTRFTVAACGCQH